MMMFSECGHQQVNMNYETVVVEFQPYEFSPLMSVSTRLARRAHRRYFAHDDNFPDSH